MNRVIVVGAGIGGLATAAVLARAGLEVTVLEAHIYPGGCAGTFYHQGYRFDAGATLAGGFYPGGPMELLAKAAGLPAWPVRFAEPSMVVHLPNGKEVRRWGDTRREEEYRGAFGNLNMEFWRWQEGIADELWDLALRLPEWPPQSLEQLIGLLRKGTGWLSSRPAKRFSLGLMIDGLRPVAAHLRDATDDFRLFVDAQLLISAQTTHEYTNALYGASALDLPRRGVVHLEGGMGAIGEKLVQAVVNNGGKVLYRQEVERVITERGLPTGVKTKRGGSFPAEAVVINLPPWNIAQLFGTDAPRKLRNLPPLSSDAWGAFMIYVGVDDTVLPADFPLHHQVVSGKPFGEGRTVFMSISPAWDSARAPEGKRAMTISTHSRLAPWWHLYQNDRRAYEALKQTYVERMFDTAQKAIPGLRDASFLVLPGTPVTFERFTRRIQGWVGGFPQTNLFKTWGPRLGRRLWMVGDSIFPGQSTAAVALGGLRVADDVLRTLTGEGRSFGDGIIL